MELKISGLNKLYEGVDGEPDFSLSLPQMNLETGKVTFVMGHNGSGKSVFMKLLAGEVLPTEGAVTFRLNDREWKADAEPAGIVRQKAEDSLAVDLTVRENLLLRNKPKSFLDYLFPFSRLAGNVEEVLNPHPELIRKIDQPCRNLSGGQRQALAFLIVASQKRPILLLDEFLAATDQHVSVLLRNLAKHYAQNTPACTLIVSHSVSLALEDADRILVLQRGRLLADLAPTSLEWKEKELSRLLNSAI